MVKIKEINLGRDISMLDLCSELEVSEEFIKMCLRSRYGKQLQKYANNLKIKKQILFACNGKLYSRIFVDGLNINEDLRKAIDVLEQAHNSFISKVEELYERLYEADLHIISFLDDDKDENGAIELLLKKLKHNSRVNICREN